VIVDASQCIFCKECIYTMEDFRRSPEDHLALEIKHSPDRFTFTVETTGKYIVLYVCIYMHLYICIYTYIFI
jgi:Fe-S-cluster-containing dehydrogenase component